MALGWRRQQWSCIKFRVFAWDPIYILLSSSMLQRFHNPDIKRLQNTHDSTTNLLNTCYKRSDCLQKRTLPNTAKFIQQKRWLSMTCNLQPLQKISPQPHAMLNHPGSDLTATVQILRQNIPSIVFCFFICSTLENKEHRMLCIVACHEQANCLHSAVSSCTKYWYSVVANKMHRWLGLCLKEIHCFVHVNECDNKTFSCCLHGVNVIQSA